MGCLKTETEKRETGENTISYEYDRFGNRAKMVCTGAENSVTEYVYDLGNRLLTETKTEKQDTETTTYTYDANGSQTGKETRRNNKLERTETMVYNAFNQLSKVTQKDQTGAVALIAEYIYRPDGLRHSKSVTKNGVTLTHTHIWDGANIVAEIGATGAIVARYLRGLSLIAREQDGACQYYFHNAHGDVVQRIDARGNLLKNYDYDAFGNEQNPVEEDSNPFRYCGEYWDKETETIYLRNRSYSPISGRFTSEDPIRAGDHWYNYCANNPVNGIDPLGLDVYYFYDPYIYDNWKIGKYETGVQVAEKDKEILEQLYGSEMHLIDVRNAKDFKKGWNAMQNSNADIEAVVINMHGGPGGMGSWGIAQESYRRYITPEIFSDLENNKEIDLLTFLSCGVAQSDSTDPIAEQFFYNFDINTMIASDGSVLSGTEKNGERYLRSALDKEKKVSGDGFKLYTKSRNGPLASNSNVTVSIGHRLTRKDFYERAKEESDKEKAKKQK